MLIGRWLIELWGVSEFTLERRGKSCSDLRYLLSGVDAVSHCITTPGFLHDKCQRSRSVPAAGSYLINAYVEEG